MMAWVTVGSGKLGVYKGLTSFNLEFFSVYSMSIFVE